MCQQITFETLAAAVAAHRVSTETWALLDRCQRIDLAADGLEEPLSVLPEMTAEQLEAIADAEVAQARIDARIDAMHERPAPRRANCGQTLTVHLRRNRPSGGVQDALARLRCKRSDCPHCWRLLLTRNLRRATTCLLDARKDTNAPRLGLLHVAETTWEAWEAFDKAMRRESYQAPPRAPDEEKRKPGPGRLRIRRQDGTVLVIGERPFAGSRPVKPAEAVDLAAEAIAALHGDKHSYRQLGAWSDHRSKEWRCLRRLHKAINLGEVCMRLASLGASSQLLSTPDMQALYWRAPSWEAAEALAAEACPSLARGAEPKGGFHRAKSDKAAEQGEEVPFEAEAEPLYTGDPGWGSLPFEPGGTETCQ